MFLGVTPVGLELFRWADGAPGIRQSESKKGGGPIFNLIASRPLNLVRKWDSAFGKPDFQPFCETVVDVRTRSTIEGSGVKVGQATATV